MIQDNHLVFTCLDGLSHFPGLLSDLPLGSFHKHLALHCDDEIANYLQHIRDVWLGLTCNHPDIVDVGTVQLLERRAPGMSDIDRQLVEEAFDSNEIFSKAHNPQLRDQIRSSVLHFKGLVPSLKSYQENMKYISIGVTVVDDLMFPDSARTKSWKRQQTDRRTFRERSRASMLGFNIPKCNLPQRRPCIPVTRDVETGVEIPLSQRWGVPYVGVLRAIRDVMFLPQLAEAQPPRASVMFVQKDLIYSFLGACGPYRLSDETVTLDGRLVQSWTSDREVQMEQSLGTLKMAEYKILRHGIK
ncbi:hypothetical protein CLIM01_13583 [Colletotrichum limetticola]|uniref:Uncharacterized protein n=1 Tax=Colletotrichum limetticola TaxID=1209924 RepID=A0ABQ9PF58_9PEZI|nr:hypothetical protein CLIM01_13583 [Colletotrichum limetticola]